MPIRLRSSTKPPPLSAPIWVAIISAGSVILVATVQFVVAPLLSRRDVPVRSPEQIKNPSRMSGLDSAKRRKNYQILASPTAREGIRTFRGEPVSVNLLNADIKDFVMMMGQITGVNFSLAPDVTGAVTVHVEDMPWDEIFEDVLAQNWLEYRVSGDVVRIVHKAGTPPWKR
jgi:hypothetical protein